MKLRSPDSRTIFWAIASSVGATATTIAVHDLAMSMDSRMVVFWRCLFILLLLLPIFIAGGRELRITSLWSHVLRGILLTVALHLGFFALSHLPVAKATALFFLVPAFATLMAGPVLGEAVHFRRMLAVLVGFVGAYIILRPEGIYKIELATLAAIACAFCVACSLVLVKWMTKTESAKSMFFSATLIAGICSFPVALPVWQMPTGDMWWWFLLLVAGTSLRGFADICSYSIGDVGFVAPFFYFRLVLVGVAGYFLFGQLPDAATLWGSTVIIGAMLFIAYREFVLRKRISSAAP